MELVLEYLASMHPYAQLALTALGGLVVMGQTYVALTPKETDDAWYTALEAKPMIGPLLRALKSFAPFQRK